MTTSLEAVRPPPTLLRTVLPPTLVVVAALAVSAHTVGFDFVLYDDDYLVYANPLIRDLGNVLQFFDPGTDRTWMGSEYLPITTLSFALDYALYGKDPHGFHATNVILYALCCWLLFLVLRKLTSDVWAAAAGALLFALHPLHAENFAWVAGRKSLLGGVFVLVSFLAYVNFRARGNHRRWYVLSFACYVLAFFSKYTAVSLPAAFLAYDLLAERRVGGKRDRERLFAMVKRVTMATLPFFVAGALLAAMAVQIGVRHNIVTPRSDALWSSAVNDPIILLYYLGLLFFPVDQCAYYLWPLRESMTFPAVTGYAVAASLLGVAWVCRRQAPLVSFAVLWFFALLVPVLNFFPKIPQMAERYLFLPSIALSLVTLWAWERTRSSVSERPRMRRGALAAAGGIVVLLGLASHVRTSVWRDSFTLWHRTLEHPMASPMAYDQLGLAYLTLGRNPRASIEVLEIGLEDMNRRDTATSRLAATMRFHLILGHLEAREPDRARRHWRELEKICAASGDHPLRTLFHSWRDDLRSNYPELFSSAPEIRRPEISGTARSEAQAEIGGRKKG